MGGWAPWALMIKPPDLECCRRSQAPSRAQKGTPKRCGCYRSEIFMAEIRIAVVGVGNCASSLVQGIAHYTNGDDTTGLLHPELGGYRIQYLRVVAAFDIDKRKVGRSLEEAIFAAPNNTKIFCQDIPPSG